MSDPLVSVVIPLFNGEQFIARAIESVQRQTYATVEIIVVDDGSTDGGPEITASIPGVQLIRQENQGVSVARNTGVARSNGEFLAFLDHDDSWRSAKLESQVRALASQPDLGFALCHLVYVLHGPPPRWFRGPTDGSPVQGYVPSCWLLRRSTFEQVGGFDPAYRNGGDTDWLARAKDMGIRHTMLPDALVDYHVHETNESGNTARATRELVHLLRSSVHRQRGSE